MSRTTVIPKPISREIRTFALGSTLGNRLYAALHHELPHRWAEEHAHRLKPDERCYRTRVLLEEKGARLLFVVVVDDSTSAEHLIVEGISKPTKI